ncbi:MAG TPA: hypothetical protein VEX37_09100 [Thermomicrobiales bacterium]|nr:hypothetical protein [Thermomicrobiales bacterium]
MSGPAVFGKNPYVAKSDVSGRVVAVLRGVTDQRGLYLTAFRSRAVPAGEIHELMITDQDCDVEMTVDRVALLAFFEVQEGGVILLDDQVTIGTRVVGSIAGFDETHMPNHQNICLRGELRDGESIEIRVGDPVRLTRV